VIGREIRRRVRTRAENRCEYCRTRQEVEQVRTYHIDHVVALQHGGTDDADNLALACSHCNWHKGTNLSGVDPVTGQILPLFDPRRQVWEEHFQVSNGVVIGLTAIGRATVHVLAMNDDVRVDVRLLGQDES
jgi:hypothetical protein